MPDVSLAFTAAPGIEPHMQESINNVWIEQYQLRVNPIETLFTPDPAFGGYKSRLYNSIDKIDEDTAVQDITTRSAQGDATIAVDMTGGQRRMTGKIYDLPVRFSQWDKDQLGELENPQAPAWREMKNAANRKNLKYCIAQLGANVTICDESGDMLGTETFASFTSQIVPVNYKDNGGRDGTGESSTFNVAKLQAMQRNFTEQQVCGQDVSGAEDTLPIILCTTDDIRQLGNDKRVTSKEFGGEKVDILYTGQLKQWGGFRFLIVPKTMLPATDGVRRIWAWVPGAFMFYSGNPFIRISELPTNRYKIQLYQAWRIALMRMHSVAVMACDVLA